MISSAQISVYPLRQAHLGSAVETVQAELEHYGLVPRAGSMSTIVVGEHATILAALSDAFARTSAVGDVVLTITLSNACPLPDVDTRASSDRYGASPDPACPLRAAGEPRDAGAARSELLSPPTDSG